MSRSRQLTGPQLDTALPFSRLPFIDFTRGVVMILMAWDHISGFWNIGHRGSEGLMGRYTVFPDFTQFILRFITHVCAPTFIFLAGTALALSTVRRVSHGEAQREITLRIIKRGVVLLLLAVFIESAAFGNSPLYFGVISCIGLCFMIFSFYRRFPMVAILAISVFIIVAHPFLNLSWIPNDSAWGWYLRVIIHEPSFDRYPFDGLYPIIPWIGVMGLGWCFGIFLSGYDQNRISNLTLPLVASGGVSLVAWFLIRFFNGFGNLLPRIGDSLQDWLFVSKYPPDLAFLTFTLGVMCLVMALGLRLQSATWFEKGLTGAILTFGRVPLFFYCVHLWLYRLRPGWITRPLFYMDLPTIGAFWLVGLLILWRLCLRYEGVKRSHPDSLLQYV